MVLAKDIADDEKQLIAYYLLKDNTSFQSPNELRNYAQDHLAQYMVPSHFIPVTHFPLPDNGKRDNQLLLQLKAPVTTNSEPITHKNLSSLEQNIINIWSCVFHCQTIDLNTNFFEIGGHSLNAAKIILKTEERLNKRIPLASVYENPTVRAFAHAVASAETIATTPVHEITQRTTPHIPLSDCQFLFWICSFFETEANRLNIIARKRVFGPLDGTALTLAFTTLLNHHDILSYQFFKCLPIQSIKKRITFQLAEYDLCQYSLTQQEIKLSLSLEELRNHYPWKKDKPLFLAKLFHLQNGYSELQISIPHIIFDDASEDILFNELSALYLQYQNQQTPSYTRKTPQYQQYITHEQQIRSQRIERDIVFWERYLQDTQLLVIPPAATLFKEKNSAFSTYFELSQELLQILPRISIQHHVNTADILCASIALALNKLAGHLNTQTIAMNLIRSVRSNDTFDNTLGCFIRLDLIKINVHHTTPLITLSKQIQQEKIRTEAYQECSSVLKCSCLYKPSLFKKGLITLLSYVFVLLFNNASLHPRILMRYGRLQKLKKKKRFMINVNMLNHFMNSTEDHHLFGQKLSKTPLHAYDLSTTPYILDFCFLRNGHTDYLVVSGNLDPAFRQRLGEEVIAALQDGYPG